MAHERSYGGGGAFQGRTTGFLGRCCAMVRHDELSGGGRLPLRIPWHVTDVSRYGRSACGCDDCAKSRGNGWRIHQHRRQATRMGEFPRTDELWLGPSGQAYLSQSA